VRWQAQSDTALNCGLQIWKREVKIELTLLTCFRPLAKTIGNPYPKRSRAALATAIQVRSQFRSISHQFRLLLIAGLKRRRNESMHTKELIIALLVAITPIAVNAQVSLTNSQLSGSEWRLTSFGPLGRETAVVQGTTVTLNFSSDGNASGSTGCNSYRGTFRVQGSGIAFSRLVSTRRACIDPRANQQEQRYLAALESANRFRLAGDRLTLYANRGRDLINFVRDAPSSDGEERYEDLSNPVGLMASFYNAINMRDYQRAYRYFETPPGRLDDFSRGYANTEKVTLLVEPPTRIEGAAGSLYAEVPTILIAHQRNGRERIFVGCYVVRKSNVSGGPWKISRSTVSTAPNITNVPALFSQACRDQ
jgi:heat shock protein HslJ